MKIINQFHKAKQKILHLKLSSGLISIISSNYEVFSFLEREGMKINDFIINKGANWQRIPCQVFFEKNQIPKDILVSASESVNFGHVKFIIEKEGIDINSKYI